MPGSAQLHDHGQRRGLGAVQAPPDPQQRRDGPANGTWGGLIRAAGEMQPVLGNQR